MKKKKQSDISVSFQNIVLLYLRDLISTWRASMAWSIRRLSTGHLCELSSPPPPPLRKLFLTHPLPAQMSSFSENLFCTHPTSTSVKEVHPSLYVLGGYDPGSMLFYSAIAFFLSSLPNQSICPLDLGSVPHSYCLSRIQHSMGPITEALNISFNIKFNGVLALRLNLKNFQFLLFLRFFF